jgi:energy-coupling factor transport system ATP-binding protein
MGLLKPSEGKIIVDGIEMSKESLNEVRKKIGIIFQNPDNQFIASSVADDIAFGLMNRQVKSEDMNDIVMDAAEQVGVELILDKAPENLSGGQKQRVAIASQIALAPEIIIFDESTSMLDPKGRDKVVEIMKQLRDQGKTIISVTHFMDETIEADHIIVLKKGKLLMSGHPTKIFTKHKLLEETRLKMPFIYDISLRMNKKNPKIKPTFKEEELLEQL